jgi:hypothetical protein
MVQSRLEIAGGRGQMIVNGTSVFFQQDGVSVQSEAAREDGNRVEGIVVSSDGRPGTWRFDLSSGYEPGSLVVVAGQARQVTPSSVVFQLSGKAGERLVFAFKKRGGS